MENIKVKKVDLLATLKSNRERHRQIFEEAVDGFRKMAVAKLEDSLNRAKAGQKIALVVHLQEPVDQTKDYDRAIRMLEMSIDDVVELDENSFAQYVMDDWSWKRQFLTTNSTYSGTAASFLAQ